VNGTPSSEDALTAVTTLLHDLAGRSDGVSRLFEQMQHDLRRVAHRERMSVRASDTLSTTALVHEAFLKFDRAALPQFADRRHFYGVAARAMRQVLTDHARGQLAHKRGGGAAHDTLGAVDRELDAHHRDAERLFEINAALDQLDAVRPRLAQVVYLRFYVGLSDAEIGDILDVDESTVRRDWLKARGWLYQHLGSA
jgi:RNA polymerase sigma factor (TIGR02999 family)